MNKEIECKTHPDAPHGFVRNASHTEDRLVCECEYWEEPEVNERIKQLAIMAGLIAPYGSDLEGLREFDYRMFAQLIVKECAEVCYDRSNAAGGVDTAFGYGYKDCGDDIKRNFGVEL